MAKLIVTERRSTDSVASLFAGIPVFSSFPTALNTRSNWDSLELFRSLLVDLFDAVNFRHFTRVAQLEARHASNG